MNIQEYLMTMVSEEAGEVTQAVSKMLRFGKDNSHPDKPEENNEYSLLKEFYQLQGMIEHLQQNEMLTTLPEEDIENIKRSKLRKVYHYMEKSKAKGTLTADSE